VTLQGRLTDERAIVEAEPSPHPESGERAADLDVVFVLDDRDGLSPDDVTIDGAELSVARHDLPLRARIHAVAVGEAGHSVADVIEFTRDAADPGVVRVARPYDAPEWATDAVYYEVYVRTFAPEASVSPLRAITERLDYLDDLGVDVVWLTPVLENDHAPHGYNITDFFAVAEDLGTRADLEELVERAHRRDMKVLFDLVLNHSARTHPYFEAASGTPDSEYHEWYDWQPSGEPETYFDWEHIANFDFDSLEVRRHLLDVVDHWAPLVDGFRCDMAWAVPDSFWKEIRDRVKERDESFLLLDETIPYIPDFHEGLFDVHFDSTTYANLRSVGTGWEPAEAILDAIGERTEVGFPDHASFLLYAENHDETRYVVECGRPAARAAAGALCTLPGAPLVYAGQEFGQRGRRDGLVWSAADADLREHYRRVISLRQSLPALDADAALESVEVTVEAGDPDHVLAFARVARGAGTETLDELETALEDGRQPRESEAAVVVCNFGDSPATVTPDPGVVPIDVVRSTAVDAETIPVEDVVVLPTVAGEVEGDSP
jgi:glycosidase